MDQFKGPDVGGWSSCHRTDVLGSACRWLVTIVLLVSLPLLISSRDTSRLCARLQCWSGCCASHEAGLWVYSYELLSSMTV